MTYIDVLVGSYAGSQNEGIQVLRFDVASRTLTKVTGLQGLENPSFVIVDSSGRSAFAVSETKTGSVVALSVDEETHTLSEINRLSTQGWAPCHLSLDERRGWLHVVNYMSGQVCRFRVAEDGLGLSRLVDVARHVGEGLRRDRQGSAHPHSVWNLPAKNHEYTLETEQIVVADLGMDALVCYDSKHQALTEVGATQSAPGSGPRHIAFSLSGQRMYVLNELSSSISVYLLGPTGIGSRIQEISTLPETFTETKSNTAADIHLHPCGRYLYASNRGHDSIATYSVRQDGTLQLLGHTSVSGSTPRNFVVLQVGEAILVANQNSNEIVVMNIEESGEPVPTGNVYRMSHPACIQGTAYSILCREITFRVASRVV